MRDVREVLPAQSAPQIPSAQDAVAGVTEQPLMEVAQVLYFGVHGMTEELRRQRQIWMTCLCSDFF
jgi:hypothetical protein